ncbi:MAG: Fic family protein [Thermoplasmata archaeon]
MEIQARRRGRETYYYLVHSYREGSTVRKAERYIGRKLPPELPSFKAKFGEELVIQRWGSDLERVRGQHKSELDRMPPSIRDKELETFAIHFTYDSNRIEGSSLTLRETALLLEDGITPSNRPLSDVRESLAHRQVFLEAISKSESLDLQTFLAWHRALFRGTKPEYAGLVRRHGVRISGSRFVPPAAFELDRLLIEFFDWLRTTWKSLHPVVLAALVQSRLVSIHPFGDGNGRVTRIAMNYVLHRKGYPMFDIPYSRRAGYYRALERSQTAEDEFVFVRWFIKRYLDEHTRHLKPGPGRPSSTRSSVRVTLRSRP